MDEDEITRHRLERLRRMELEMIKATAAFEQAALKPTFLLNGGGLVVYLALYGALVGSDKGFNLDQELAKWAMLLWVCGLVTAAVATALGAWSQFSFRKLRGQQVAETEARVQNQGEDAARHNERGQCFYKRGARARFAAVVVGVVALLLFIAGVGCAFFSLAGPT